MQPPNRCPNAWLTPGPLPGGKTTFFQAHLRSAGLRFVNADVVAGSLELDPYAAARAADLLRRELLKQRESFVFETVFSDPMGDKLTFLREAAGHFPTCWCLTTATSPHPSAGSLNSRMARSFSGVIPGPVGWSRP
jgi:hypothetical protein